MADLTSIRSEEELLSRLKALEQELATVQAQLEHLQRLATIGTLSAGVLHEANNLLTPALAYSQMAIRRPDDEEMLRKAVSRSVSGIQGASQILRAILDFTTPADRRNDCADVNDALRRALDCIGRDLGKDQIELKTAIPHAMLAAIRPLALQQVFLNLLLNSARALRGAGGGRLEIDGSRLPGAVMIQMSDNGPGIPDELQDRIFEPFVSGAAKDAEDPRGGSGLGLSMCRHLIDRHGGTIAYTDTEGGGATFTIRLPAAQAHASAA